MPHNETPMKGDLVFIPFRPEEDTALNEAIAEIYSELKPLTAGEDEYKRRVEQLTRLYALKKEQKIVDPNTLLTIAGNVVIAVVVLKFEQTGVVTTKLFSFLTKR